MVAAIISRESQRFGENEDRHCLVHKKMVLVAVNQERAFRVGKHIDSIGGRC